jgi:hypothetical protein
MAYALRARRLYRAWHDRGTTTSLRRQPSGPRHSRVRRRDRLRPAIAAASVSVNDDGSLRAAILSAVDGATIAFSATSR